MPEPAAPNSSSAPPAAAEDAPSPVTAALLAWLIPGAGHFYIGYNFKALLFAVMVLGLMLVGSALGRWRVVVPPDAASGPGFGANAETFWYVMHLCTGLVALFFTGLNRGLEAGSSTGLAFEVGHLYARVAGMLNLLVVIDAYVRAGQAGGDAPAAASGPAVSSSAETAHPVSSAAVATATVATATVAAAAPPAAEAPKP